MNTNSHLTQGINQANTIPATALGQTPQQVPLNSINGGLMGNGPEFLVQNHPDTVNNHGKGHNNNKGKIEIASLNANTATNMNSNPNSATLSNVVTEHHILPHAPGTHHNNNVNTTHNNNNLLGKGTHDVNTHTTTKDKLHNAKEKAKEMMTATNIVSETPAATHLGGNPNMNTNTHIDNNHGKGSMKMDPGAALASSRAGKHGGLGLNAAIGDEVNTNPVATTHPHANVAHGDMHTNQLQNTGHHLLHHNAHHTTTGNKHNALGSDTTAVKETPQYH